MAVALIVAAGSGERLGAKRPKAFVVLAGRPMLEWSVEAISAVPSVEVVVVALPPGERAPEGTIGVPGGSTRAHSVRAALSAAPRPDDGLCLVHDAARPLISMADAARTLDALDGADGAVLAAPVPDTVKRGQDGWVSETLDRSALWAIQTPQAFHRDVLERGLDVDDATLAGATDCAGLVERAGGRVRIVAASSPNFKVTTTDDLRLAECLFAPRA